MARIMLIKRKSNPLNPLPRKMPSASPGKNPRFIKIPKQ